MSTEKNTTANNATVKATPAAKPAAETKAATPAAAKPEADKGIDLKEVLNKPKRTQSRRTNKRVTRVTVKATATGFTQTSESIPAKDTYEMYKPAKPEPRVRFIYLDAQIDIEKMANAYEAAKSEITDEILAEIADATKLIEALGRLDALKN